MKKKSLKLLLVILPLIALTIFSCKCREKINKEVDCDKDGVIDKNDKCLTTKLGAIVNESGCEIIKRSELLQESGVNYGDSDIDNKMQVIITFPESTSIEEINELKKSFGVKDQDDDQNDPDPYNRVKSCSCDKNIQLWTIPDSIDLDGKIGSLKNDGSGVSGGRNRIISMKPISNSKYDNTKQDSWTYDVKAENLVSGLPYKSSKPPIVAIMDSGLDYTYFRENEIKLLNTTELNRDLNCNSQTQTKPSYGWNFAGGNGDLSEGSHKHGTYVAKTLIRNLKTAKVEDFYLLPLKIYDENYNTSYFDIACAFSYINKLIKMGYDIPIVNASFGGNLKSEEIDSSIFQLKNFIDKISGSTVITASAGNSGLNIDVDYHFPASYANGNLFNNTYKSINIIAVAGHDKGSTERTIFKNIRDMDYPYISSSYGKSTVEIAAPFEYILIEKRGQDYKGIRLPGTSYSSPIVASKLLDYILKSNSSLRGGALKNQFLNSITTTSTGLQNYVMDGKYVD